MSAHDDAGRPPGPRVLAGRYRLVDFIARGGMAEVWEGHDVLLVRRVAVKLPHPHLGRQEAFRKRFRREAVAAARLSHPNIVAIYDTGTDAEDNFIVMERVDGPSLRELLAGGRPLPVDRAVGIAAQVARALEYAHRQGVVHRDIKPANILIRQDDVVKVADFGIAKAAIGDDMTQTGTALGTARYLAPEQVEGGSPDRRSDIYALGVVLYEMLCGRPPFQADNELALAFQHLRAEPPPPSEISPSVPSWLEEVVLTALAKSPEDRFATADELRDALSRGPAWRGPPPLADSGVEWSRPAAYIGAEERGARPRTVPDRSGSWSPTGPLERTPSDRGQLDGDRSDGELDSDDARMPTATRDLDSRPPPPPKRPPPDQPSRPRRRFVPLVALVVAIAAVVVAAVLVSHLHGSSSPSAPSASHGAASTTGSVLPIAGATSFDPPPGDGLEDDADLPHLLDGDPRTSWHTEHYSNRQFGGLKPGVGFVLALDQSHRLQDLMLTSPTPGYNVSVFVADSSPSSLAAWGQPVGTSHGSPGRTVISLRGHQGSHVLVWFTTLSPSNVVQISGAQLTG